MKKWVALAFMVSVINENIRKLTSHKPSTLVWNIPRKKSIIAKFDSGLSPLGRMPLPCKISFNLFACWSMIYQLFWTYISRKCIGLWNMLTKYSVENISDIFNCLRLWNSLIYFAQRASEISTFLMCWGLLWVLWGNKNGFWELLSVLKYFVVAIEITSIGPFCSKLQGKEA